MPPSPKRRRLSPPSEIIEHNAKVSHSPPNLDETRQSETARHETNMTELAPANEQKQAPILNVTEDRNTILADGESLPKIDSDRMARFSALKSRATASARSNLAEAKAEANRTAMDPSLLANLSRRSAVASHNLLKADTEEEGGKGAFERKRAWDYTIEESEKWDERMAKKKGARDNNSFADYSAEAGKIYERQIRELEKAATKDGGKYKEDYNRQRQELVETAARSGGLEIVEMENGEMIAIDKEGRFYADKDNTGFTEQKPKKENIDRLVDDLKKAEEVRLKKRKERGRDVDEGDVTYINDKNKQFNMKLARFYDRYTTDIRESFERGTAL